MSMCTSRRIWCGGLVLFTAAVLMACQQPSPTDVDQTEEGVLQLGSVEAVDTVSRAVAPKGRRLVIEGGRGTVSLTGADEETAQLQFVRRGRGETTENAREVLEDVEIEETGTDQSYTFSLKTNGRSYAAVDVTGTVPRDTKLRIDRSAGPVTVTHVAGPVKVSHEHGPLTVRRAAASVEVETKNGDVEVGVQSLPGDATVQARTVNGDVTLSVQPDARLTLSAETSVGVVRTRGLSLTSQEFMPRDAGGKYSARMWDGGATVNLRTKNGSILIQATDTTQNAEEPLSVEVTGSDTTVTMPSTPDTSSVGEDAESDTMPDTTAVEPDTAMSAPSDTTR